LAGATPAGEERLMKHSGAATRALLFANLIALLAACGGGDEALGPAAVAGEWSGSTSQDREILFVVVDGNVAVGTFNYTLDGEGCAAITGGVVIQGGAAVPIEDDEFTIPRTQIGQNTFLTAEGEFTSASSANGTFTVEDRGCATTVMWTASKR
jgi:hypothetical protein